MPTVIWQTKAVLEFRKAFAWYEAIRPELADRFEQSVEDAVKKIAKAPQHFAVVHRGQRRIGVDHFPYGLYFVSQTDQIIVLACIHGKRHPRRWESRRIDPFGPLQ